MMIYALQNINSACKLAPEITIMFIWKMMFDRIQKDYFLHSVGNSGNYTLTAEHKNSLAKLTCVIFFILFYLSPLQYKFYGSEV